VAVLTRQTRIQLFRSMLLEQLSDAFSSAVSLAAPKSGKGETILRVSTETKLQQPRSELRVSLSGRIS
jgi:hypothetical protein